MADNPDSAHITQWLTAWRGGDAKAPDQLFAALYPHLCHIAARFLRRERADHTLEPGALVNEWPSRLLGSEPLAYADRTHFLAVAAT